MNFISSIILIIFLSINCSSGHRIKRGINWNGNNWAFGCDFSNNDLTNVQIRGEDCGGRYAQTSGCTHFTWTKWNGGTCWMKKDSVTQNDAFSTNDNSMVCGAIQSVGEGTIYIDCIMGSFIPSKCPSKGR